MRIKPLMDVVREYTKHRFRLQVTRYIVLYLFCLSGRSEEGKRGIRPGLPKVRPFNAQALTEKAK